MLYQKFYQLVAQMRAAQRAYFKDRTRSNLRRAKELERKVDRALAARQRDQAQTNLRLWGG